MIRLLSKSYELMVHRGIIFLLLFFLLPTTNFELSTIFATSHLGPEPAGPAQIEQLVSRILSLSVGLIFVALVFVLIWAGIRYLISGGEAKVIQQAASTITWAGLGILFLAIAWMVLLLIEAFTGVKLTVFCLNPMGCP